MLKFLALADVQKVFVHLPVNLKIGSFAVVVYAENICVIDDMSNAEAISYV